MSNSNIIINKEVLKSTKPCTDRWKNYLENYSEFEGSFDEFLDLELISYDDKIWVARKLLNKNHLVHFAILCAESVLDIFEGKYPEDKRVSDCLSYMKTIVDFSSISQEQREKLGELRRSVWSARYAAYADAYDAAAAAYAAAYAAAAAAAYADADAAAAAAAYAAADAAAAAAAYAAADAAAYAHAAEKLITRDEALEKQRKLNLEFLKMSASVDR